MSCVVSKIYCYKLRDRWAKLVLFSLPLNMLYDLYESTLTLHFADVASPQHRLQSIDLDISSNRLFKAVRVCDNTKTKNRPFLKIKFANKGIDVFNLSNILNQKSGQSNIPLYFQNKESPCISYSYSRSVVSKSFNNKRSLQQIDFNSLSQNPLPCTFSGSEFLYAPWGHVVTEDLNIVWDENLEIFYAKAQNQGTCLIFMAPELWYYHGCMWSVCQAVGQERGCRTRHSFRMD